MSSENPSAEEVKGVIDEKTNFLTRYHINPLEKRINVLEALASKEGIQAICQACFSQKLKEEEFQNKVGTLFSKKLKEEEFLNKAKAIATSEIKANRQDTIVKIILYVVGGFVLALIGGLVQKALGIF